MASMKPEEIKIALESPVTFWNSRYGQEEFAYGTEPNAWVKHSVESADQLGTAGTCLEVVELGAGEGRNAVYLAKQGHTVFAVDMSSEGTQKTLKLAKDNEVTLTACTGDATCWQPLTEDGKVDAVVAVFLHMPNPARQLLWQHIQQILRPGGKLIGEWYSPEHVTKAYGTGGPPVTTMCVDASELEEAFPADSGSFEVLESTTYDIQEGRFHHGTGAVTRCVWVKAKATTDA